VFAGLSLDQAPPFRAPLKFFLVAPLFAIIAGVFTLFSDSYYPHTPNIIANVHLLTIGFILMSIFGALQQMLPVLAGAVFKKPLIVLASSTNKIEHWFKKNKSTVIIQKDVPCRECNLKECPYSNKCMELIKPDEVVNAIKELLKNETSI